MVLAGRCRRAVSGHPVHKHLGSDLTQVLEDNRAGACYNANENKKKAPFAGPGKINHSDPLL
jgi:hypothetical protein